MADNPLQTASSSSTTTAGEVSFADDPRAFYNKETGTWRLEDDDGNELEYDQVKGVWLPVVSKRSWRFAFKFEGKGTEGADAIRFSSQMTC